ncbi:MAG: hypothetical protein IPN90_07115 [Elusimicrobia bacterium]|nr:hypothetical protein [Elusimicrobiota bacterium]
MTRVANSLPEGLLLQAASDLRLLLKDGRFISSIENEEIAIISDRAIHDIPWPRTRWIEHLCADEPGTFSQEELSYLVAHRDPIFSLYEVLEMNRQQCARVRLRDVLRGGEVVLMDVGISISSRPGHFLATRVISWNEIHFTCGVGLPFSPEQGKGLVDNFIWLHEQKKALMGWDEMMRRYAGRFYLEYRRSDRKVLFV